jgi:hypothetical protein
MALRSQGVNDIDQARLVASIRGVPANTPAYARELARALTGMTRDRLAGVVVSQALVYERKGDGRFVAGNSWMNAPAMAFLLAHGMPVIVLYKTGGSVGHFVLINGVSLDSEHPLQAVHYQVEDPWPLDKEGQPLAVTSGVRKQLEARSLEANAIAFVVPIIVADTNVNQMKSYLDNVKRLEQNPKAFRFDDLVHIAEQSNVEVEKFDSPEVLKENVRPKQDESSDGPE